MTKVIKTCFTLLLICSWHAHANVFSGTWTLISGEYVNDKGNLVDYKTLDLRSLKVISDTHFSFVTKSGDAFWGSGAGTYQYTNKHYIETPVYTSYDSPKGKQYTFTYKFEGDKWFSARWENETRVEYEVWQKVND